MNRLEAFRFVCRCLAGPISPGQTNEILRREIEDGAVDWPRIVAIASQHLVTPTLYWALEKIRRLDALPPDLLEYFVTIYDLNRQRNLRLVAQTKKIAAVLNSVGVEPVGLKGIANILAGTYENPALRILADLDFLVPEDRLDECFDLLLAEGYGPFEEIGPGPHLQTEEPVHKSLVDPEGRLAKVELHRVVTPPRLRTFLPPLEVLEHSSRIDLHGRTVRIPSLLHRIVHNIGHAQLQHQSYWTGEIRLRDLYDFALLIQESKGGIAWSPFIEHFDRAGYGNAPRAYLMMAEELFGLPRPEEASPPSAAKWRLRHAVTMVRYPWLQALSIVVFSEILTLRRLFSNTPGGRRTRRKFLSLGWYVHHVKNHMKRFRQSK